MKVTFPEQPFSTRINLPYTAKYLEKIKDIQGN